MVSDRDELVTVIYGLDLPARYSLDPDESGEIADAILARWRLVPVDDYQIAWLTYRNSDGSMRYTTVASGHGDGDWIVDGSVAAGYADVQVIF